MKTYRILLLIPVFFGLNFSQAQVIDAPTKAPVNRAWEKIHTPNRKRPVPYPSVREADIIWAKRVWRFLDLREKMNLPLYYPKRPVRDRKSLASVLMDAVSIPQPDRPFGTNYLTAYKDEDFTERLTTMDEVKKRLVFEYTDDSLDASTGMTATVSKYYDIKPEDIIKYAIVEDWFFDKRRSQLDVRIVAICPIYYKFSMSDGVQQFTDAPSELFWIYFPEARYYLVNQEAYNPRNDAERRTYDELFIKRRFASYIYKVENDYDRTIADYATGLDALLESERVKNEIFEFEQGLWEF
ncbi:MAG: gliding motility protein GldN [Bacteroidales bacterium]|nr:gliding motility protein GldN [Bacteroidales bacterium]